MAFETSFERQKAVDDAGTSVQAYLNRVNTIPGEISRYQSDLAARQVTLNAAKEVCDALVQQDPRNSALLTEQTILTAKVTELATIKASADALALAIGQALAG